ncbi:putative secreted protein [Listeria seeligeri FSL S4-171]|nr:putative secreted protein [Listeria seeligeri FSL S4-171]
MLKGIVDSVKKGKNPITGQNISKAQGFGIISGLVFQYTVGGYKGKKLRIPKNILDKFKKANKSKN